MADDLSFAESRVLAGMLPNIPFLKAETKRLQAAGRHIHFPSLGPYTVTQPEFCLRCGCPDNRCRECANSEEPLPHTFTCDERVEVRPDLGFAILLRVSNVGLVVGDWRIATEADLPGCRGHHQMLSVRDAAYSQREPLPWLPALWFMPSPQRG